MNRPDTDSVMGWTRAEWVEHAQERANLTDTDMVILECPNNVMRLRRAEPEDWPDEWVMWAHVKPMHYVNKLTDGWYVLNNDHKTVLGPFGTDHEARAEATKHGKAWR